MRIKELLPPDTIWQMGPKSILLPVKLNWYPPEGFIKGVVVINQTTVDKCVSGRGFEGMAFKWRPFAFVKDVFGSYGVFQVGVQNYKIGIIPFPDIASTADLKTNSRIVAHPLRYLVYGYISLDGRIDHYLKRMLN